MDSDDYVDDRMYQTLYEKAEQYATNNFDKIKAFLMQDKNDLAFGKHSAIMPEEIPYRCIRSKRKSIYY